MLVAVRGEKVDCSIAMAGIEETGRLLTVKVRTVERASGGKGVVGLDGRGTWTDSTVLGDAATVTVAFA